MAYDDYAGDTTTAGRLTTFSPVYGTIDWVGDQDWFRIYLSNTTTYLFDQFQTPVSATNNLDSFLRLVDASGNQVPWAYDDDAAGNRNAEFRYTPTDSGFYYLSAQANSYSYFGTLTGSYGLYADEINHAPVVTGNNPVNVARGQTILASSLFSARDVEGNSSIVMYEFLYDTARVGYLAWSDSALVTWDKTNRTLIVPATALNTITYTGDVSGTETLQIAAYDGSLWSNWGYANIKVSQINHAPVLDASASPTLTSIANNLANPSGNTVAQIVVNGSITDADTATPPEAIVIETVNNSLGTWQYSTNSGSTWQSITGLSIGHGLALSSTAHIRLLPNGTASGTTSFTFGAWDQSDGAASGTYINYTAGLGTVSLVSDTASITVNSPAAQPTKTASEIFNNEGGGIATAGMIRVLADFSKAAYSLQPWEDRTINDYMPNADQAKAAVLSEGWVPLELGIPSLSATSMVGGRIVSNGMSNGFYTHGNAAVFVARSTDAVVISFRGTNDNASNLSPVENPYDPKNDIKPDVDQWGKNHNGQSMKDHYGLFAELFSALDVFLLDVSSNGIKKIYVTGHSLGGAMTIEYMSQKWVLDDRFQAVTFAAPDFTERPLKTLELPGLNRQSFAPDSRITQIEISQDPVPGATWDLTVKGRPGQQILFFGDQTANEVDWYPPLGKFNDDNHSMDYYRQITKSVDSLTWQTLIDKDSDLKVLIGATSGPFLDPVSPVRSQNQYDTYFIVDGNASGYVKSLTTTVSGFHLDNAATTALAPILADGVPVNDGVNVSVAASEANYLKAGSTNYDVIYGGKGDDVLTGGSGSELLVGGDGSDWLYGGGDSDTINGDAGNDYLYGQADRDVLDGGDGADIVSGGDGNDVLSGGNGADGMYGDAGVDTMNGNGGGDFMAGGDDNDIMHGDDGQDWIYGEWRDDTLYGDAGNDFLFGNFGNDTLIGGLGNDLLYGGEGGDTFVFTANQGEDFIVDFSVAQGDHISIASGTNGITTAAQALAHMRDSGANAVLDLGAGNYVMLMGVATSALHVTDFVIA